MQKVIDLVSAAGIDVSDWANYAGGKARAAANPKYCYEWSFVEPKKVAVFNLWFEQMKPRGQDIVIDLNFREFPAVSEFVTSKPGINMLQG
jgi:hypothetical protein